jgi:hypothetical protein
MAEENAKIDQNYKGSIFGVAETSGEKRQLKVNESTDRLLVDASSSETPPSGIANGRKVSTTPGTAVKLVAASTTCKRVVITALENNADIVVVGGSGVIAGTNNDGAGTRTGIPLFMNQAVVIDIDDVSKLYIDVVVSGNGVSFSYLT